MLQRLEPSTKRYLLVALLLVFLSAIGYYGISTELDNSSAQAYESAKGKFAVLLTLCVLSMLALAWLFIADNRKHTTTLEEKDRQLKQIEDKCCASIKYTGDAIFILDEQDRITDLNEQAAVLLGYAPAELLSQTFSALFPPPGQGDPVAAMDAFAQSGKTVQHCTLQAKNGRILYTELTAGPMEGTGRMAIVRDLTERRQHELALKQSEENYRYLFENNPACIIIWDLETYRVLSVNKTIVQKYGYTQAEWDNMRVFDYRPAEDYEKIKEFARDMLNGNKPVARRSWTHLKKNGEEMYMEIASHKLDYQGHRAILSLAIDVTEQVRAEKALRKSETNFRSLIDHAADAIFMVDNNGIIFDVNRSACQLLHYRKEELTGMSVLQLHPNDALATVPGIWSFLKVNQSYTDERKLVTKNGGHIDVEISRNMLPDLSGAIAIVRDIRERKEAAEKLRQSEERHRALIENISDGILLVNESWQLIYQSPSVERITGYTLKDRKGNTAIDFIHPDDRGLTLQQYERSKSHPGIPVRGQYRGRHKTGHYIWIEVTLTNLLAVPGIQSYVVVYRDITERKQLEEQQLLMASIVNSSDDAIISKTLDGTVTSWNRGAEKVLGYQASEIIGRNIMRIIPSELEEEEKEIIRKMRAMQSIDHYETKRIRKDGTPIFVSLTISPITDATGKVVGASKVLRDITESKRYDQKLMLAAIKAQEEERYEMGGELHDNVCQILASSLMFLGLMKKSVAANAQVYFEQTHQMISLASAEIRNLSHRLAPALFDNATLEDAFKQLLNTFNVESNYTINLYFDERSKSYPMDRDLQLNLYRILQEQLRNIIKHAKASTIDVSVSTHENSLQMTIADNGIGFNQHGFKTGIGLANMNRRAQLFAGSLAIASEIGKGCRIVLTVPIGERK